MHATCRYIVNAVHPGRSECMVNINLRGWLEFIVDVGKVRVKFIIDRK